MSGLDIAGVLGEHEDVSYDLTTPRQYTQYGGWNRSCACGEPLPDGDAPDDVFYAAHRAHLAAVLTSHLGDWLGSEEVVERVLDVVCTVRDASPRLPDDADSWDVTRAALAALGELLGGRA